MANKEDNLIRFTSDQNREEASKNGKKGGVASGIARRQKATMRQVLLDMLNEIPRDNNPKGLSYQQMATLGLIKGAVKGNAQNYKTMVETLGELNIQDNNNSCGVIVDLIEALNNAKK